MMVNLVDVIRGIQQQTFARFARNATYTLAPPRTDVMAVLPIFLRGLQEDDLFAGAMQQDQVAVIDADVWRSAFTDRQYPSRMDRIQTASGWFSVEQWRGAPNDDEPVFYKMLLRGSTQ
jgi:hypothetical protein